jgi:serine/threonine-protein kinase HipA
MAEIRCLAEVRLWGSTVGAVAEEDTGRIIFEYDPEFRRSGLEISPMHLPLSRSGPMAFDDLRRKQAFDGLPGVFADSLPDAFGNLVIRAYYAARGEPERAMSPVQRLLYVGQRAIGALTYHPAEAIPTRPLEQESLELASLVREARAVIAGTPDLAIPEIYRIGASAGGMRPKALVLHDPVTGELRSGYARPREGEVACLLKFDGVGDAEGRERFATPQPFNRIEAAYAAMASAAGLDMADVTVLEGAGGYAHLLIRRFDFEANGQRRHQHTLGGLLHVDYNDVGASSYEEYLRATLRLGLPPAAVTEGFRRMVFNVVAINQDDHVKNLSFGMGSDGLWDLTPAYDLTYSQGTGWTSQHQMRVADKRSGITRADLVGVGELFAIKSVERLIDKVVEAVAGWPKYAAQTGVPADRIGAIDKALQARRKELAGN